MILHGYYRSSAAYRVRIALALKGLQAEHTSLHLRKGDQTSSDYLKLNPQGLVPTLVTDDGDALTQSLAILEWLEETHPDPSILPGTALQRARIRAFSQVIACDVHPVQNLKILKRLRVLGHSQEDVFAWARQVISDGLGACESLIAQTPGPHCFGDTATLADICLVPQLYNARRFELDLTPYPRLISAEAACIALDAFASAAPERQPDAE